MTSSLIWWATAGLEDCSRVFKKSNEKKSHLCCFAVKQWRFSSFLFFSFHLEYEKSLDFHFYISCGTMWQGCHFFFDSSPNFLNKKNTQTTVQSMKWAEDWKMDRSLRARGLQSEAAAQRRLQDLSFHNLHQQQKKRATWGCRNAWEPKGDAVSHRIGLPAFFLGNAVVACSFLWG